MTDYECVKAAGFAIGGMGEAKAAKLLKLVEIARLEERERCAKIADEHARRNYPWGSENTDRYHAQADWAERIAAVIRRA